MGLSIGITTGQAFTVGDDVLIVLTHASGGYARVNVEAPREQTISRHERMSEDMRRRALAIGAKFSVAEKTDEVRLQRLHGLLRFARDQGALEALRPETDAVLNALFAAIQQRKGA